MEAPPMTRHRAGSEPHTNRRGKSGVLLKRWQLALWCALVSISVLHCSGERKRPPSDTLAARNRPKCLAFSVSAEFQANKISCVGVQVTQLLRGAGYPVAHEPFGAQPRPPLRLRLHQEHGRIHAVLSEESATNPRPVASASADLPQPGMEAATARTLLEELLQAPTYQERAGALAAKVECPNWPKEVGREELGSELKCEGQ